jgi:hypothetical protein
MVFCGPLFTGIVDGCESAIAGGRMCTREGGGIKYGRVIEPSEDVLYGPGTAHHPTVTRGGRAGVSYLLPQGAIQFPR